MTALVLRRVGGVLADLAHARVLAVEHPAQRLAVDAHRHEVSRVESAVDETFDFHAGQIGASRRIGRLQAVLIHDVDDVVLQKVHRIVRRRVVVMVHVRLRVRRSES